MSDDGNEYGRAPITGYSADDTQHMTEEAIERVADSAAYMASGIGKTTGTVLSASNRAKDTAVEKGMNVLYHPKEYLDVIKRGATYIWVNFPPLSWFGYGAAALNAVPLTILLGFLFCTIVMVLGIAGCGIFLAESFFIGLGLLFLLPVLGVMTFAGLTTAFFSVFGYFSYRSVLFVLRGLGVLSEEIMIDTKGVLQGLKEKVPDEFRRVSREAKNKEIEKLEASEKQQIRKE
ncbi:4523_t:CDS:2 [Diversispora eburnea]|uniref:4523_t:CDS:1 n=1 Tax=Diversispora eburnea TaxID=1213867 RepID=A0A9N8ZD75_9GLOM|nr:4523_t:CDS:2 [Diversispora eburnea]